MGSSPGSDWLAGVVRDSTLPGGQKAKQRLDGNSRLHVQAPTGLLVAA